jgi:raffinose/stachyose/melibiose transport system permease protein
LEVDIYFIGLIDYKIGWFALKLLKSNKFLIFIIPSFLLFTFSVIIPFFMGINIAFTNWDGISAHYDYVGFKNFIRLFSDKDALRPILNTFEFAILTTVSNNLLSLIFAILITKCVKGKNFVKVIFFIPMALSPVLAAFVWGFIYKDVFSTLFSIQSLIGNPDTVISGIVIICLWNSLGSNLVIYIAGLQNIPNMYYEASSIDGANLWQQFRHITLPLLVPTFTVCITLTFTSCLREFSTVMAATGGGPANYSQTISIYIYQNLFSFQKAGYGQAVSLVFMFILVIIGTVLTRFFRSKEVEV